MKCPRCQHENPPQAKFCLECGARVSLTCTKCRSELPGGARFCLECGERVASQSFTPPATYTPKHLAERILTSKAALESERKQVTVLFADLKGSMELLADRDPEEARKILDPLLERMMEAVHRYEGTVNQVMGDGIMALFGAPLAHEDHAVRACYAALWMQESVKKYAEEVFRSHGVTVRIRVGLNSGEVVVRAIGSDLQMDYTAVGQTTHLAARMEQLADPGTVLLTPATLQFVEGYVEVKERGVAALKGLVKPVEVYELVGARWVRSRLQATAARGLTRFVGRDPEVKQLHRALERAGAGHGQVVAVVGEPGVGKSRLYWEFINSHRTDGWLALESQSVSYGKPTSYLPVIDLLKGYFEIEARDEPHQIRQKVSSKLLSLDDALWPTLPAFLALLDLLVEDVTWRALDPHQRRQRTVDAVKRLLLRESQVQPLIVLFEDLHWIDHETQAVLDNLVESLPTCRVLLLVNYRAEYQDSWGSKTYYARIRLDPLDSESSGELLQALLGDHPDLTALKRLLAERSDGNPFFLEESVRTLLETECLIGDRGAHRLVAPLSNIHVAATAQAVIAARIDRLLPEDKRLLQTASVVGKDVPLALLAEIAELPQDALQLGLDRLRTAEFLYETDLFADLAYTFKHALTHEVAYQMLAPDRRRVLHAAVLTVGEKFYAKQTDEKADWLALHALQGEVWNRAVTHLQRAAARAIARGAHRGAVLHLENALAALDRLPPSRDRVRLALDLRIDLRHGLTPLGLVQRTLEHLRAAEALAIELNDRAKLSRVVALVANCLVVQGRYREALVTGEHALSIARELGDRPLQIASQVYIARARLSRGEYEAAVDAFHQIILSLDERPIDELADNPVRTAVFARSSLASTLAELGAFAEAEAHAREAIRRAEALGRPDSVFAAHWGAGLVSLIQGYAEEAIDVFGRLLALCRTHDLDAYVSRSMAGLGLAKVRAGQTGEGLSLLEQAVALDATAEPRITQTLARVALAEAYFLAEDLTKALTTASEALHQARTYEERAIEAYAGWVLAMTRSASGDNFDVVEGVFQEAVAIATEIRLQPLLAHCWDGLGNLYERRGRREKAAEHRQYGQRLFEALGMRPWIARRSWA